MTYEQDVEQKADNAWIVFIVADGHSLQVPTMVYDCNIAINRTEFAHHKNASKLYLKVHLMLI